MVATAAHVELYKKYRPGTWPELIGQEKVAKSLRSAVAADKLPTAYGFFGPRGCGKTSAAFVLAKAINCENRATQKGDPCNTCEVCVNVNNGAQVGVNYISMANNGSVDSIRELVQKARLHQPVRRSVWILDEVHNISKQGFDALLIPIEDASMPALFIFCSTEVDKIPQTILSRIQQRRFNLVPADAMLAHVKDIAARENLSLTDETAEEAVRLGRGSARDTMSALEALVETGESAPSYSGRLLEAFVQRNLSQTLAVVAEATANAVKARDLAEQLFEDTRDLLLVASGVDSSLIGMLPLADPQDAVKRLLGVKGLSNVLDDLGDGVNRISSGSDARIQLEITLVKSFTKLARLQKAMQAAAAKN